MKDKKKILVTGSCGFIFGNFLRKAVYEKQPYQLVSVDRVNANNFNSMYWNKNHTFYIADIRDQHVIDTIFQIEKPDIVLHGAAETFVDYSLSDPNSFVTSNVLGTQVIINNCVKHKVNKLIYISTDEVYGQLSSESEPSWTEESALNPRNPYSATKAAGELLVKAAYESFGLNYNITRSSNNYGPRQTTEKLIPKTIKCILQDKKIPVYGKGLQVRDWTHVYDNCSALFYVINSGKNNETYNIAASQEFSNIEVIHKICNIIKKGYNLIEHIDDPRGSGHDFRYSVNPAKIKELGWKPQFKFNEGIEQCVNWYLMNQWMFK
jgi:dTDP-glucose 4,6-dehydratase